MCRDHREFPPGSRETFRETLETLEQRWEQLDIMEKKNKVAALIENITIKDGTFKVHFRT